MDLQKKLINLRHKLHSLAETSQNERETAEVMISFLKGYSPAEIITGIGGNGLAAVFESNIPGPRILIRCELDALPIPETIEVDYASRNANASHKCGHDGHMAIVGGWPRGCKKAL
jgi:metal-dependent amidase/aminoacylase/carboxypeptidase family protein